MMCPISDMSNTAHFRNQLEEHRCANTKAAVAQLTKYQRYQMDMTEESEKCLSMHQPWASLLVAGIKRIEGRSWTTKLRGRLWIHATQRVPKREEIDAQESFYRTLFDMRGEDIVFPEHYPTGVLLGSVGVVDCMKAEEVENWDGLAETLKLEVQCPICFLCENPKRLILPQKMRGYQGIWNLPKKTVKDLLPGLKPSALDPAFSWKNYTIDLTQER